MPCRLQTAFKWLNSKRAVPATNHSITSYTDFESTFFFIEEGVFAAHAQATESGRTTLNNVVCVGLEVVEQG
jgi:hypothetical protein